VAYRENTHAKAQLCDLPSILCAPIHIFRKSTGRHPKGCQTSKPRGSHIKTPSHKHKNSPAQCYLLIYTRPKELSSLSRLRVPSPHDCHLTSHSSPVPPTAYVRAYPRPHLGFVANRRLLRLKGLQNNQHGTHRWGDPRSISPGSE
jgi:hypothetical protein